MHNSIKHMPAVPAGRKHFSFKTWLRRCLGDGRYRGITQALRLMNFLLHPRYEAEITALPLLVAPGATCFDIGANYGHYTRVLSPLVGARGAVYAFEPSGMTSRGLRLVKRVLRWKNVHVEACALADAEGTLTLHIPIKSHGGLGIALAHLGQSLDRPCISEQVPVQTLDGFVAAHAIGACDFIKCDVEGAEWLVLQGGRETLARFKPTLLLEVHAGYLVRHGHTPADIDNWLRAYGYGCYLWEDGALVPVDALQHGTNNLLIHPSRLPHPAEEPLS